MHPGRPFHLLCSSSPVQRTVPLRLGLRPRVASWVYNGLQFAGIATRSLGRVLWRTSGTWRILSASHHRHDGRGFGTAHRLGRLSFGSPPPHGLLRGIARTRNSQKVPRDEARLHHFRRGGFRHLDIDDRLNGYRNRLPGACPRLGGRGDRPLWSRTLPQDWCLDRRHGRRPLRNDADCVRTKLPIRKPENWEVLSKWRTKVPARAPESSRP